MLVNTLTADHEYSRSNTENLLLLVQMQLSLEVKKILQRFITFLESTLTLMWVVFSGLRLDMT